MKNNKKIFLLIEAIFAGLVFIVAIFMIQDKAEKENSKIAVIVQDADSSRWGAFKYGLEMAAIDNNLEIYMVSTGKNMTTEEEKSLIESEMDRGVKAVIVQPILDSDAGKMLKNISERVPVMQVESTVDTEDKKWEIPVTKLEHYKMGLALAEEVLKDFNGNLEGRTLGIISEEEDTMGILEKERGVMDGINQAGGEVLWSVKGYVESKQTVDLCDYPKVDLVLALDNGSVICGGEAVADEKLHGAVVYGVGNSMEAFYYLDTGAVQCLVVPDEFNLGYQSLSEVARNLDRSFDRANSQSVSYTIVRRETLFSKENQNLLFSLTQ